MTMKKAIIPFLLAVAFPSSAADLYGRVWTAQSAAPAAGAVVHIACPTAQPQQTTVDQYGRYRLTKLPAKQNCQLSVEVSPQQTAPVTVYSGSGSKDINIELYKTPDALTLLLR
ncbi:MAG: hypothetical protein L3J26_07760 [Candidatus Polarisedimenticolaceae bacterium]|nr:hypothetical protein [Candidatus Polarisedimenticolaceae bacterium]